MNKGVSSRDNQTVGAAAEVVNRGPQVEKPPVAEKGRASNLKARFEQMAMGDVSRFRYFLNHFGYFQGQDKVAAERERRKREDDALKEKQRQEETERQRKIEEQWKKQDEAGPVDAHTRQADEEKEHSYRQQTQVRRSGPAGAGAVAIMPGMAKTPEPVAEPSFAAPTPAEPEFEAPPPAPVPVFPSAAMSPPPMLNTTGHALKGALRRQASSDDEVNNDDDWETEEKQHKTLPPPAPAVNLPPPSLVHIPAGPPTFIPGDRYDVVPSEEPPAPPLPVTAAPAAPTAMADRYDYVPEEVSPEIFVLHGWEPVTDQEDAFWMERILYRLQYTKNYINPPKMRFPGP